MTGAHGGREIEAKFFIASHERVRQRLESMGARLVEPRALEVNYRFDDAARSLRAQRKVLRLRTDARTWLTYKGAPDPRAAIVDRVELEVSVSDAETTRGILEALGFIQTAVYEKYRSVYEVTVCKVMLDELPYGNFLEIEGMAVEPIRDLAGSLGLRWEASVRSSYLRLWERYCSGRPLEPGVLTFEALRGTTVMPEELGVEYADG